MTDASDMSNARRWDSMRQIVLMPKLETHYNVELTDRPIMETTSVTKIRELLSRLAPG